MNLRKAKAVLRSAFRPTPNDLAARDWRRTAPRRAPSVTPVVVFCAPLMGRHMAQDWGAISDGVARMVRSLLAQTDRNWLLLLCSQDRPDSLPDDPRIHFLPFTASVSGMDKSMKVAALMAALPQVLDGRDGYMHALDADDMVHPDLVGHIRGDNNGRGYWHRYGGMIDAKSGAIGHCGPRSLRYPTARPFMNQCGSSAAIYVDFRAPRRSDELARAFYGGGHRNFRITARAHGVTLDPVPFASALYVMNTGENMRDKRGKMGKKLRYLRQNAVPAATRDALQRCFGWIAPDGSGTETPPSAAASAPPYAATPRG